MGNMLVFSADRGGRIWPIKVRLSDQSQVFNEEEEEIDQKALELGSVWTIKLAYPILEGRGFVILEMKRIRPRAPE
jgi:hypothetical protein